MKTEFQVGDMVKVVEIGTTYSTYWDFFKEHGLGEMLLNNVFKHGGTPIETGEKAKIIFIGEHRHGGKVAVIRKTVQFKSYIQIMGLSGIERLKSKKEIKRDELVAKMEQIKKELEELEL